MDFDDKQTQQPEDELEFTADLITLTDEDGVDHTFELVDTLEMDDSRRYVALIAEPENPDELLDQDGDLVIMKIVTEGEEEILELIEDDDEFEEISEIFMERLSDLYEFDEEDAEDGEPQDD